MKKSLWKRVLACLLAAICAIMPLSGSVQVRAASGEIKIQQKDVYPMERYDSDGSLGNEWMEDILASSNGSVDHTSFCLNAVKDVKPGPAEIYPMTDYLAQDEITTLALYGKYASEVLPGDPAAAYGITQILIWEDLNIKYGWGRSWKMANDFISYDLQESLKSEIRGLAVQNKGRYIGHGEVYDNGNQPVGYFWLDELTGFGRLLKSSANTGITEANACYSLEGASYGIYSNEACTVQVGTFTTGADGSSNEVELSAGNYWVKEIAAPKGYVLDEKVYSVSVVSGETSVLEVSDEPLNDPAVISLQKVDRETGDATQAKASLAGAQFTIRYYDGYYTKDSLPAAAARTWVLETKEAAGKYVALFSDNYKVSGDDFYRGNGGIPTLPLGTVTIEETKAPVGYQLEGAYLQAAGSTEKISGLYVSQIREDGGMAKLTGGNTYIMSDSVIRGGVKIQKYDQETQKTVPQGNATLAGAEFAIINKNSNPVQVDGKTYASGQTVMTIAADENGLATTAADALPYGHYQIKETKAPSGYQKDGRIEQEFDITQNGVVVELTAVNNGILDQVIRGGVRIQKYDQETQKAIPQGDATLAGAEFAIINQSRNPVKVGEKIYASGQTVMTIVTDEKGLAATAEDALPYGHYQIKETKAPSGYQNTGVIEQEFDIIQNRAIVDLTAVESGIQNQIIRGGVKVQKRDLETKDTTAMGGASLEGAKFAITYQGDHPVIVDGKEYHKGQAVAELTTNTEGTALTASDALPYGKYEITETEAPEGYLVDGTTHEFRISQEGVIVELTGEENSVLDQVKRGDFEIRKIDADNQGTMAGVQFNITSSSTGESHLFSTDENGYYSSESSWNQHSVRTNQGGAEDGLWFGTTESGAIAAVDDSLGALPYDTYQIEEIKGENNGDKEMFRGTLTIRRDKVTVDLGNIENTGISLATTAKDAETDSHYAAADADVCIIDTVEYTGLTKGSEYVLIGTLVDAANGEPILDPNGKAVTAERKFTARISNGKEEVEFSFNGTAMNGKDIVVFEELYLASDRGVALAQHKDLDDQYQTIHFPGIGTSASDSRTQEGIGMADHEMVLVDTVSYWNLQPKRSYVLEGVLMDKETGSPILIDGRKITAETAFRPEESSGKAEVTFRFDSSSLKGKSLVVFETLTCNGKVYASHEDLEAEEQTIQIPEVNTKLKDPETGTHNAMAEKEMVLVDKVSYRNLIPGREYTMRGTLMEKASGKPLLVDGKQIMEELKFTPEKPDGSVELTFRFDGSLLAGKTVVAFEMCLYEGIEVAVHEELESEDQSVHIPSVSTQARAKATDTPFAQAAKDTVIIDEVSYTGLVPGETYQMQGILMDRATGKPLYADGKEIAAETEFVPETADGKVELEFRFDASALQDGAVVVYETCLVEVEGKWKPVAEHKDIDDIGQTVLFPSIGTKLKDTVTGTQNAAATEKMVLVDEVSYRNLIPGREYTMRGTLMDKAAGDPLLVGGKEVTAEITFTPEKPDGKVELTFTFDGSLLAGKTIVAFEKCLYEGREIAVHTDLDSTDQSVYIPEIATRAKDGKSGTQTALAEAEMVIVDEVGYRNLIPGMQYTMRGILMDQESGSPLLIGGKEVTAELLFVPEQANGKVELTFHLDGTVLAGKTVVVFERCLTAIGDAGNPEGWEPVAFHEDIQDEAQAVAIEAPKPGEPLNRPPKTGDGSHLWIWALLAVLSAGGLVTAFVVRSRKHGKLK